MSTSSMVNEEIDRVVNLCSYISQMVSRIQLMHLSNVSLPSEYIKLYQNELLSMSENVEGSAVLLQSLLAIERRKTVYIPPKKSRHTYTRDELLKLRQYVSPSLSIQIKNSLNQVVERENNHSIQSDNKPWRNIRTILV